MLTLGFAQLGFPPVLWQDVFALFGSARGSAKIGRGVEGDFSQSTVIEHGFPAQEWGTSRQALGLGGNVRKGEHRTTVVYADRFSHEEKKRSGDR
jgi:antirestriction protein ArdC